MGECRCHWTTHPCDGKPIMLEPAPDCSVAAHVADWTTWTSDEAPASVLSGQPEADRARAQMLADIDAADEDD